MNQTNRKNIQDLQQEFAKLYGTGNEIIWDLYTASEKDALENKLKILFPDNNTKIVRQRNDILEAIWAQRKFCDNNLLMAIIFILVGPSDEKTFYNGLISCNYSCHVLFRVRKCMMNDNSKSCCMVFIDENARVYKNWSYFLNTNVLPSGVMFYPKNGIYTFNDFNRVVLEKQYTPACQGPEIALKVGDISATALGVATIPALVTSIFIPVAAPVIIGSLIVGAASSLWSVGRSIGQLVDRGLHDQSINLDNREARAAWIGITGGVIGLSASGATQGIIRAATNGGEISTLANVAVKTVNIASMTVNGIGIGNGIIDIIIKTNEDTPISALDILQLSASLVLFTHSIYNYKCVVNIINESQNSTLNFFRSKLGTYQKNIFDKYVGQIRRLTGTQNMDIIRATGSVPDNNDSMSLSSLQIFNPTAFLKLTSILSKVSYLIINADDMTNCLLNLFQEVTIDIIEMLLDIALNFLSVWNNSVFKKINMVLPIEAVLWKAFKIAKEFIRGQIIATKLLEFKEFIFDNLMQSYKNDLSCKESKRTNYKCSDCSGYYSITNC